MYQSVFSGKTFYTVSDMNKSSTHSLTVFDSVIYKRGM